MVSENPPSHTTTGIGNYHAALLQLDRFLFGALGDVTLSQEELEALKAAIQDAESGIGKRAREYHRHLADVLATAPVAENGSTPPSPNAD